MSCYSACKTSIWLVTLVILIAIFYMPVSAQPINELEIGNVSAFPGETNVKLPIFLTNPHDTVTQLKLWLQLDRPDLAIFNLTLDTVGTLLSGMTLDVRSLSGMNFDIQIATDSTDPTQVILPQDGQTPLVYALLDIIPFTLPPLIEDHRVNIMADLILNGHVEEDLLDSSWTTDCFICLSWCGEVCCNMKKVSTPPGGSYDNCDSTFEYWDCYYTGDTSQLILSSLGSITLVQSNICGDGDNNGAVDIADLTFMIAFMFRGGVPPHYIASLDLNGSGEIDITDLTAFVCYLFLGCDPPSCGF